MATANPTPGVRSASKSAGRSKEAPMGFLLRRLIRIIKQKRRMRRSGY
jgi:hypothetical protein